MSEARLPVAVLTDDMELEKKFAGMNGTLSFQGHPWNGFNGLADPARIAGTLADDRFHAVCIGPDVPEALALDVARSFDLHHPEVGVVLLREPTADLWQEAARAGVRDIVGPDRADDDLLAALLAAAQRSAQLRATAAGTDAPRSKVIVVLSPKGGSGKTMVTTNLAMALATAQAGQAVVVDLDCVFGDVAGVLGMVPEHTIGELATIPSFDSTTLKVYLTRHERSGLYVLAGSGKPEEGEAVTDAVSGRVVEMLARDFPFVIVDTAAGLDERALAAIEVATDIVLLASLDVASVRNLGKEIDALDRLGLTNARRHFILNRADARVGLEVADVETAVGLKVEAALPSSRLVPLSMNQGRTLVLDEPDSHLARELVGFANRFLDAEARVTAARPSRFSRRRR
jgi:pilus assembly protein CpaE